MKHHSGTAVVVLSIVLLAAGCVRTYSQYTPMKELPRMIYVQGELGRLKTDANQLAGKGVIVEVTTTSGITETGKLVRITDCHLVMSPVFCSSGEDDPAFQLEAEKMIPKDEILILKVF